MEFFKWLLFFLPLYSHSVKAQVTYTFQNDISVIEEEFQLTKPFSGGFIAPQYSTIDLDFDGINDLFVFERSSSKISTFLLKDGTYKYAPQYESLFPSDLNNWVLLRDYNCDGKMDLFTSSIFGVSLYENTSTSKLEWDLKYQTIFTEGSNGQTNLQMSGLDLPAIGDVDNDGDLDILNFNFATGGGIEFHKNLSVENTGICNLELVRTTKRYGDFEECTCDTYVFGTDECFTGGRDEHSGGKTILSFYNSNSLTQDLVIGQEYCLLPGYLPNTGTLELANMNRVEFGFPAIEQPLRIEYPAFYEIDFFDDGSNSLMAVPNSYIADGSQNYESLSFLYEKNSEDEYKLTNSNFLKEEMIDVGHMASPVFIDLDFDGDEDLLIGTGKMGTGAAIWMYKNIGTASNPSFELSSKNFLSFKEDLLGAIRLQIFDVDKNSMPDLIVQKVIENELIVEALLNSGSPISPYSKTNSVQLNLPNLSIWDSPHYFKLGNKTGLLIGKQAGNLEYFTTTGSIASPTWQLVSSTYLGIMEDFIKRNLRIITLDFDANGTLDMLSSNDSGEVLVYSNFLSENTMQSVIGFDPSSGIDFNLNFGKLANPTVANLYGTREPSLSFGLLQGGVNILKSTKETDVETAFTLKITTYPNPIENKQMLLYSTKNGQARVLDAAGKEIISSFDLLAGEQVDLQLILESGIYFVEVVSVENEKAVKRIVILD